MKKYAVLVAGGNGSRMNSEIPKQFLLIKNKPVLFYTIKSFVDAFDDIQIILVVPQDFIDSTNEIIKDHFQNHNIQITSGGATRFESVKNGLKFVSLDSIVFVHDAVRCLIGKDLIIRCYEQAKISGTAIPAINSKDSIRIVENELNRSVNRSAVKLIQTPQVFKSDLLLNAFDVEFNEAFTDEASVVEFAGHSVTLVEGDENNIKITYPIDLIVAEKLLQ